MLNAICSLEDRDPHLATALCRMDHLVKSKHGGFGLDWAWVKALLNGNILGR